MRLSDTQTIELKKLRLGPNIQRMPDAVGQPELTRSIKEHGVLVPLIINWRNQILDGYHRYLAAVAAGVTEVPVKYLEE